MPTINKYRVEAEGSGRTSHSTLELAIAQLAKHLDAGRQVLLSVRRSNRELGVYYIALYSSAYGNFFFSAFGPEEDRAGLLSEAVRQAYWTGELARHRQAFKELPL